VAVHFWAGWCEPCHALDAVLSALSSESPSIQTVRVEAEEATAISEKFEVAAVPLFLFFSAGKLVDKLEGANAATLTAKFRSFAGSSVPPVAAAATAGSAVPAGPEALHRRLESLISRQPIMLFMKGSPEAPRCGFSSRVIEALQSTGVPFGTFDILQDEEVRQGLKEYSNWPTYPQLFVNGELVGGCDIILEMAAAGELEKELREMMGSGGSGLRQRLETLVASKPVMLFMKGALLGGAKRCFFCVFFSPGAASFL
jgi:Grx4 family monothiol glutaredoxin